MKGRTPLGTIDGSAPNERMCVAVAHGPDGGLVVELQQQHYGPGIGWFNQRSLTLDSRQWRQLQAMLGNANIADDLRGSAEAPRDTLPFPGPLEPLPNRRATGSR